MAKLFTNPRPQFFDKSGKILSYGRILFLEAGTLIPKAIYTDQSETIELDSSHELDGSGYVSYGGVWLGRGKYRCIFQSFTGRDDAGQKVFKDEYTVDNVDGAGYLSEQSLESIIINTVMSLRDINDIDVAYCLGYETAYDNGGGWFFFDKTSTIADDSGGYISRNSDPSLGRYIRAVNSNYILPEQWGALPDRSELTLSGNFTNLISYAESHGKDIVINSGTYYVNGSIEFTGDIHVEINSGVLFENILVSEAIIKFSCKSVKVNSSSKIVTGYKPIPYTKLQMFPEMPIDYYVDWFGLSGLTPGLNHTVLMQDLLNGTNLKSTLVFSSGANYNLTNSLSFINYTLKFINNSKVNMDSGSYSYADVVNDNTVFPPLHLESDSATIFNINHNYHIDHWNIGSHALYTRFITKTTNNGLRQARFIWNKSRVIPNDGDYTNLPDNQVHVINAPITLYTMVKLGNIQSCINGGLIPSTPNISPMVSNVNIECDWFRHLNNNAADIDSLNKALYSCGNSIELTDNPQYVTGNRKTFILNGSVNIDIPTKIVKLRDIRIESLSGNSAFTTHDGLNYTMHFNVWALEMDNVIIKKTGDVFTSALGVKANRVVIKNSNIENIDNAFGVKNLLHIKKLGSNTVTELLNFKSIESTGSGMTLDHDNITMDNIIYEGSSNGGWIDNPNPSLIKVNNMTYIGNDMFAVFQLTPMRGSTFTNNSISEAIVNVRGTGVLMAACSFLGANLTLTDPQQHTLRGLKFTNILGAVKAQIDIVNTILNSNCLGLSIEDCDFYRVGGQIIDNVRVIGENYGIGNKVSIKNNNCNGYYEAGTTLSIDKEFNIASTFGTGSPGSLQVQNVSVSFSDKKFLFTDASYYTLNHVIINSGYAGANTLPSSTSDIRECLAFTLSTSSTANKTANFRYVWAGSVNFSGQDITQKISFTLSSSRYQ